MATQSSFPVNSAQASGFVGSLFDLSFNTFITKKIISFLYVLAMAGAALFALSAVIAGFNVSAIVGILALILSPIPFLLFVIYARVVLELISVIFRIEELLAQRSL